MTDRHELTETNSAHNDISLAEEPKANLGTVPIVNERAEDHMAGTRMIDPSHTSSSTNLATSADLTALLPKSESHDVHQQPEHREIVNPVGNDPHDSDKTLESDKTPAGDTGSRDTSMTERFPSQAIDPPVNNASCENSYSANQVPSEPTRESIQTLAQGEPKVAITIDHDLHPSVPGSTTPPPPEKFVRKEKQLGHEGPESSTLPANDISIPHETSPAVHSYQASTVDAEPTIEPRQSEVAAPTVLNAAQGSDPLLASHESLKASVEADTSAVQTEPVLEALPKSEASVAEDPASAITAINNAASQLDHIMEEHGLNKDYEVKNASSNNDLDSLAQAHSGAESGNHDPAQQQDHTVSQSAIDTPSGELPSAAPLSIETQAPLGIHESLGAAPSTDTQATSTPADADMDDGSSVSTIHYLGTHATSIGTGSVNGDPGDTSMDDGDSALGDDVESYVQPQITPQDSTKDKHNRITESLSASMLEYRYENGRRYHAFEDGKYHLPNDEKEADRLDFQHHIWLLTLNGELHRAPLSNTIQNVLDVGTGTGIWAIDFANAYPNARVIGTDLSPIQPSWVPPNLSFMVDDAEASQDWEFTQKFDYIHSRLVVLSMRDWPRYLKRCYNNLKPGGWIELQEVQFPFRYDDDFPPNDSPLLKWSGYVQEATSRVGVDTQAATKFIDMLQNEGFVNINKEEFRWPIGSWSKDPKEKELGKWMVYNALEGVESAGMALFSRVFGWSKEEILVFLESVRKDIRNKDAHYYSPISVHYAQKPIESGGEE